MIWWLPIKFCTGRTLKMATTQTLVQEITSRGMPKRVDAGFKRSRHRRGINLHQKLSSKHATTGTKLSQSRNERFPLRMSAPKKSAITTPAICRANLGQKINHGAISSARKLNRTPSCKIGLGKK